MALLQKLRFNSWTNNIFKPSTTSFHSSISVKLCESENSMKDIPVEMENPFTKEKPKCILCSQDIEPNYKNVRLLSQFVSNFTGKLYGRHITGLCRGKHAKLALEINKARRAGLMGYKVKNPNFLADPNIIHISNPIKPHKYD